MDKRVIQSNVAPKAIGPYSIAIQTGNLVFTSGQLGLEPASGNLVPGGIEAETHQALTNIKNVLNAAGCSQAPVVLRPSRPKICVKTISSSPGANLAETVYCISIGSCLSTGGKV